MEVSQDIVCEFGQPKLSSNTNDTHSSINCRGPTNLLRAPDGRVGDFLIALKKIFLFRTPPILEC